MDDGQEWEGKICRWCNEGEYVIKEAEDAHLTADPSNNTIECSVCGEWPMTFEEVEAERAKHTTCA